MNFKGVQVSKKFKNDFSQLKINKDSINGSVNSSMRNMEGEIDKK
jgi:hypothetical protein